MSKRRWRHYETRAGRQPVKEFLETLSEEDVAAVAVAMKEVREKGLRSARHLHGKIYEVRTSGNRVVYRLLIAPQGRRSQVLLALVVFSKKTQKTPPQLIRLAQQRLRDWERRGNGLAKAQMGSFL
jgi:phage-related protein